MDGVLGVVDDETYQIILGPGVVTKVAEEFGKVLEESVLEGKSSASAEQLQAKGAEMKAQLKKKNDTPFKNFLRKIGNIFIP